MSCLCVTKITDIDVIDGNRRKTLPKTVKNHSTNIYY